jgi:hypothetical protein
MPLRSYENVLLYIGANDQDLPIQPRQRSTNASDKASREDGRPALATGFHGVLH